MQQLEYPFDSKYLITHKKKIFKEFLDKSFSINKKMAILGGFTTHDIKDFISLMAMNNDIKLEFYESSYNRYLEEGLFPSQELIDFNPDYIYICTSFYNIDEWPLFSDSKEDVKKKLDNEYLKFEKLWESLKKYFPKAIIFQNNFSYLSYRLLGNMDTLDIHGRNNFINELNSCFKVYKNDNSNFYIVDVHYLSSSYGIDRWNNLEVYYLYKYALDLEAIPYLSFEVVKIVKALCGKNKKSLALDLDNTLWGGIIGDDGVANIKVGQGDAEGEAYLDFHKYLKSLEEMGIPLNVVSKNDLDNALEGFTHEGSLLTKDDFISIKANWEPKNQNIINLASEMGLTPDAYVFVDDNPMERDIVLSNINGIAVPDIGSVCDYIKRIDHNGYFEVTTISLEDAKRNEMYKKNVLRYQEVFKFEDYDDYLKNLKMKAIIKKVYEEDIERVSQLSLKSNQFNLTTKRYNVSEIKEIVDDDNYLLLDGRLEDKFGDNGLVTVIIGNILKDELNIELWIQSCRVLKRNLEYAMLDELVRICKDKGILRIYGYYYPTAKNKMVLNFYDDLGFKLVLETEQEKKYVLELKDYENKNKVIEVNKDE